LSAIVGLLFRTENATSASLAFWINGGFQPRTPRQSGEANLHRQRH